MNFLTRLIRWAANEVVEGARDIKELIKGPEEITPHKLADVFMDAMTNGDRTAVRALVTENPEILEAPLNTVGSTALLWVVEQGFRNTQQETGRGESGPIKEVGRIRRSKTAQPIRMGLTEIDSIGFLLVDLGANVNAANVWKSTPLMGSARGGLTRLANRLLEKGANVNEVDVYGYTALMWASSEGRIDMVRLFLNEEGIDLNVVGKNGLGALSLAIAGQHSMIVEMLLDKGAGIDKDSLALAGTHGNYALAAKLQETQAFRRARKPQNGTLAAIKRRLGLE